ncbi:MAG: hypothetical protein R2830_02190 [Saprospiraceae bacterium]
MPKIAEYFAISEPPVIIAFKGCRLNTWAGDYQLRWLRAEWE